MVSILRSNVFIILIANQIVVLITVTATQTHLLFFLGGTKIFALFVGGGLTEKIPKVFQLRKRCVLDM